MRKFNIRNSGDLSILGSDSINDEVFGTSDVTQTLTDEIFGTSEATLIGSLKTLSHGVSGELHSTDDETTLEIRNFQYDGKYLQFCKRSGSIASFY